MLKVSILTPTYNRENQLEKCYESLLSQTNKNFEWVIIDDGSTDSTSNRVKKFMKQDLFPVKYYYKENAGKHTALNRGFNLCEGELTLILDSDDVLTKNAVERITSTWESIDNQKVKGLSFLRMYSDKKIIGDSFPENNYLSDYIECRVNKKINGDKCEVFETKTLKKYQFPTFEKEKFIGEHIIWIEIAKKYQTLHINEAIYITEYLEGGLTDSGRKLRISCPNGGIQSSLAYLIPEVKLSIRLKNMLLLHSYLHFSKKNIFTIWQRLGKNKLLFLLTSPFGWLLYKKWNKQFN